MQGADFLYDRRGQVLYTMCGCDQLRTDPAQTVQTDAGARRPVWLYRHYRQTNKYVYGPFEWLQLWSSDHRRHGPDRIIDYIQKGLFNQHGINLLSTALPHLPKKTAQHLHQPPYSQQPIRFPQQRDQRDGRFYVPACS